MDQRDFEDSEMFVLPTQMESLASIAESLKEIILQLNFLCALEKEKADGH